ncbi:MAG: hypothetical protein MMC33_003749 [Icmadophila ericetorum]|nr:hypothetical protein [Icmadophila ericetorum]
MSQDTSNTTNQPESSDNAVDNTLKTAAPPFKAKPPPQRKDYKLRDLHIGTYQIYPQYDLFTRFALDLIEWIIDHEELKEPSQVEERLVDLGLWRSQVPQNLASVIHYFEQRLQPESDSIMTEYMEENVSPRGGLVKGEGEGSLRE